MTKLVNNTKLNQKDRVFGLLLVAIVITIIGFLVDLINTFTYLGTDLGNRVFGAKLMLEGIDSYFLYLILVRE